MVGCCRSAVGGSWSVVTISGFWAMWDHAGHVGHGPSACCGSSGCPFFSSQHPTERSCFSPHRSNSGDLFFPSCPLSTLRIQFPGRCTLTGDPVPVDSLFPSCPLFCCCVTSTIRATLSPDNLRCLNYFRRVNLITCVIYRFCHPYQRAFCGDVIFFNPNRVRFITFSYHPPTLLPLR